MVKEETMLAPWDLKASGFDQLPLSSEESPNISLNKTQDDTYTQSVCKTKDVRIMEETMSQSSRSNDFLLNTRPEDSSPFSSRPHANDIVDSGPHEETMSQSSRSPSKPQEERSRASQTVEPKAFYTVEERNDPTSMSKGSNDNSVNLDVVNFDTVGGMLDNSANTSSQFNISSAEGTEPNSDNNYGHDGNVSSSLENDTFIFGTMDNSSSVDTIFNNSSHICSQPPTDVTMGGKPYEDIIEKQDPVEGSQTNDVGIVEDIYTDSLIAGLDDNSSNFALDDNNTVGSRLDESANASSNQMLKNHTSVSDEIGNDFLLDTRPEDSSPFSSRPHANDIVDSGPHEETMSQSSRSPSKPQEERSRASQTVEQKAFYTVEERNDPTSMSKGSNDNSVNLDVVNFDTVGGMLDNSANTSSQHNISSAEGTEPNSDNNYGHDRNVSSSLENDTFIFGKMDNSSSLDTIFNNSSHICSQPPTDVTMGGKPYEDIIKKQDPVEGSQTNDVGIVEDIYTDSLIAGLDDNSSNFALDDNNTVGSRIDESANASSNQMLKNHTSESDEIGNDFLLNTRPEDSSPFSSRPHANDIVDSGPHEDTLELKTPGVTGLENNLADNSSVLGTFGMDKTKGKKYSQDENNGPTISKADKEQNALFVSQNAEAIENKYIATSSHEDDNPTNSDTVNRKSDNCASAGSSGNPISAEDTELNKTAYEHDIGTCSSQAENNISRASKTQEQNVLSTDHDTIVIEKESAASSSQGSNGNSINWTVLDNSYTFGVRLDNCANTSSQDNISSAEGKEVESGGDCEHGMDTSSSQMLKSCTSMVDKTDASSSLNTRSKQPYPNVTVDSGLHEGSLERQKPDVRGREFHATGKALILLTSENDNINNENLSCESQDEMVPISLKTEQEEKELAETNDKNISYGSQEEQRPRGFKTKEQQHVLNDDPDITKMKHIDYSNHASNEESANFSDAVIHRLDNSTNEGRRANTSSPADTELDKKNDHGHEIKIQSNQELINPTYMDDKMESNCPLDTRPNKSSFFRNQSYASAIEDCELHEDTIKEQKPVRDSESLVEEKTFTDLELSHGISSDNEPEYQVPKINNTKMNTYLGNEVDFKASETQTLGNDPFVDNQFNCFPSSGTLHMVAASVLTSSKKQKKSSKSQNTDDATRQSNLKLKMKVKRQKSQKKLVRNAKSNIQDKSARVLQPKRGEKAFNETNREKRTHITYTPEDGAGTFKASSYKEKEIVTRMNQSIESIRPMGSEKLKGSWAAVVKYLVFLWLFHNFPLAVRATPIPALTQWRQHTFCTDGYPLTNETLVINNIHNTDAGCMFRAPAVPGFYNCSKFNALIFRINATCLEMFTTDLQTQSWDLEYGAGYNGKNLESVRGELFTNEQIMAKVYQDEGAQARGYLQSTTTPNGTTSKPLDRPTWSRIFGPLAAILVTLLVLVLLGGYFVKRRMSKSNTQSPTANGIELHSTKKDGEDTNEGLLSNGTSEPQHKNQLAEI